jgi:hypothetical protein
MRGLPSAERESWPAILLPIFIAVAGIFWVLIATGYYQDLTGHELRGIVGVHYSMPNWGFDYREGGRQVQFWAFDVPLAVTLLLLVTSAVVGCIRKRREFGWAGIVGLCLIHLFCALGFLFVTGMLWFEASDVFI